MENWDVFALLARAMELDDPFFRLSADDLVDRLLAKPAPMREGVDGAALDASRSVQLTVVPGAKARFRTPSGEIEILNQLLAEPMLRFLPTYVGAEASGLRL